MRGNSAANECRAAFTDYNLAYQQGLLRDDVRPTPVVVRKPPVKPKPKPVPTQVPLDEQQQLAGQVVEEPPPPVTPETYASPRPPAVVKKPAPQPPATAPATPQKPKPADSADDDWSDFWTEAP
jgi:hypothetical protein